MEKQRTLATTLAIGMRQPLSPTKGFTLIEVLVVMIIMVIITTVAVLALGDGGRYRRVEYRMQSILTLLNYAEEMAILSAAELKFHADSHTLYFDKLTLSKNPDGSYSKSWTPLSQNSLKKTVLPPFMTVKLNHPVLINSNGNTTPFTLTANVVNESSAAIIITGNAAGELTLTQHQSTS